MKKYATTQNLIENGKFGHVFVQNQRFRAAGPERVARPDPNVSLIGPRGGLTLCVFLLTSCYVYPTWLGRARTERKQQQQHDSVVQRPRAIIAPRELQLIRSGIPLSLT